MKTNTDTGKRISLRQFSKLCGSDYKNTWYRLKAGYSLYDALFTPESDARCMNRSGHGQSKTATYSTWESMMGRVRSQERYLRQGIKVCERWLKFENFLEDMGERPKGMTLDRFPDQKGDYELKNCRWATPQQQSRNTSRNVSLTAFGETLIIPEWADRYGVMPSVIHKRIARGYSPEDAVSKPNNRKQIKKHMRPS